MDKMSDTEFLRAFEALEIAPENFHHRDHIRLAWICHRESGPAAGERIASAIRRFAAHIGKTNLYHETITQAWMTIVAAALPSPDSETFLAAHPELLDKSLLARYYSAPLLASHEARARFVLPDLRPLPRVQANSTS